MNREMYMIIYYDIEQMKNAIGVLKDKELQGFKSYQGFKWAYCRHDKDPYKDGYKKAHYHLVLQFPIRIQADALFNVLENDLPNHTIFDINKANKGAYAYLIHANAPKKAQYDYDSIVSNIDDEELFSLVEEYRVLPKNAEISSNATMLFTYIRGNQAILSVGQLCEALIQDNMFELLAYVAKNTYFVKEILLLNKQRTFANSSDEYE